MISPKFPNNEVERLKSVHSYGLLDTLPSQDFDDITSLIAAICDTPISLITLLDTDRNFLKSHFGLDFNESPRNISFCGHAILETDELFIVEDSRVDPRFSDNPLVEENGAVFYAGAPLRDLEGHPLGTLCVFDTQPKKLTELQKKSLLLLAKQVMKLFELHKNNNKLRATEDNLQRRNTELKHFAGLISHDLKSPLANITSLVDLLKDEAKTKFSAEIKEYLNHISDASTSLRSYIDNMLSYYKSEEIVGGKKEKIEIQDFYKNIEELLFSHPTQFEYPKTQSDLFINKMALEQIFINLISNALKYNKAEAPMVSAAFSEDDTFYHFSIRDNGIGINESKQSEIFELFKTIGEKDRFGNYGSGIGLATVKKLVKKLGGTIQVKSEIGKGTTFSFSVKK